VTHGLIATIAALVLGYAAVSRLLATTVVSAAMVFAGAGLVLGAGALDWVAVSPSSEAVRVLAEATLAIVLFTDAARIDLSALRREAAVPARLLGIGLPLTILAGAVVADALLPGLLFAEALVLAVVLAPTDAALGLAVVTDRRLPTRIRQSLNVESGLNDGICVPLLLVALAVADAEEGALGGGEAVELVVEKIGWGIAIGLVAGAAGAGVLRAAAGRGLVAGDWAPLVPTVAALLAFALAEGIGGSGFIAAFVGGALYGPLLRQTHHEATAFAESLGQLLDARVPRLVRPAWAGVDRVRGDRPRGARRRACRGDRDDCVADDRPLDRGPWRVRWAADDGIRAVVREPSPAAGDGGEAGHGAALACAAATAAPPGRVDARGEVGSEA
jgi:NhaP-type Na+/H+ or K+/H+ antiporter